MPKQQSIIQNCIKCKCDFSSYVYTSKCSQCNQRSAEEHEVQQEKLKILYEEILKKHEKK